MSTNEARRVVTVERGTQWEDGFAPPRVMLQPYAAPSVLGLFGFAAATFMVALHLTGVYGGAATNGTLWPFAAAFGGIAQFMAGMWAFRVRDTIATAMHGMWGSFWIAFGILNLLIMWGKIPDHPAARSPIRRSRCGSTTLAAITVAGALAAVAESLGLFTVLGLLATGLGAPRDRAVARQRRLGQGRRLGARRLGDRRLVRRDGDDAARRDRQGDAAARQAEEEANIPGGEPTHPIQLEWAEPGIKKGQ